MHSLSHRHVPEAIVPIQMLLNADLAVIGLHPPVVIRQDHRPIAGQPERRDESDLNQLAQRPRTDHQHPLIVGGLRGHGAAKRGPVISGEPSKCLIETGLPVTERRIHSPSKMVLKGASGGKHVDARKDALKRRFPVTMGHEGARTRCGLLLGHLIDQVRQLGAFPFFKNAVHFNDTTDAIFQCDTRFKPQ